MRRKLLNLLDVAMKKELSLYYLQKLFDLDNLSVDRKPQLAKSPFDMSLGDFGNVAEAMREIEDQKLEDKAKRAAKNFYTLTTSLTALELALEKVDKDSEGILSRE
jgi:hypothetical protein